MSTSSPTTNNNNTTNTNASPSSLNNNSSTQQQTSGGRGLTNDEARRIMSGGSVLQELVDNPEVLSRTSTTVRKEAFTSLFVLIADSRSVFTSGVRHESADAMTLLTQILNPRGTFARSAVAAELCTFIASTLGLSGLRRLRLDRHILSNKEGVAPAGVAFIVALSLASTELNASNLLNGNAEAEMRLRGMTASFSRNGESSAVVTSLLSARDGTSNTNNNQQSSSASGNAAASTSSPTTNSVSTVSAPAASNIANDPLLRRDLQSHETARPHRTHRPPQTTHTSGSSSSSRSSRYAVLPPVPAGQQMSGSNPAYVRGSTEVTILLTPASVPSAVKSHARAFGLGGRTSIPNMTQGADLEKRMCLPLKLIFPGLNDPQPENSKGGVENNNEGKKRRSSSSKRKQNNQKGSAASAAVASSSAATAANTKNNMNDDDNDDDQQQQQQDRFASASMMNSTRNKSFSSSPLSAAAATVPTPAPFSQQRRHQDPNELANEERIADTARQLALGDEEQQQERKARLNDDDDDHNGNNRPRRNNNNNRNLSSGDDNYEEDEEFDEEEEEEEEDYYTSEEEDDEDDSDEELNARMTRVRKQREELERQQQAQLNDDDDDENNNNNNQTTNNNDNKNSDRHNVRPKMKLAKAEARRATKQAEAATAKGSDAKKNTSSSRRSPIVLPSSETTSQASSSPSPATRSRQNSTVIKNDSSSSAITTAFTPPRNPVAAKQQQQQQLANSKNPSSSATPQGASSPSDRNIILPNNNNTGEDIINNNNAAAASATAALPPLNDFHQQSARNSLDANAFAPDDNNNHSNNNKKSNSDNNNNNNNNNNRRSLRPKPLIDRFLTANENSSEAALMLLNTAAASTGGGVSGIGSSKKNNNNNTPKVVLETSPSAATIGWHTPTSTYPLCAYKIVYSPLHRRGASVPTYKITAGHRHTVFVVGNGEAQDDPTKNATTSPLLAANKTASSSSNSTTSTSNSIINTNIMVACSGENLFYQCSASAISSANNQGNNIILDNANLHQSRQFVSVGSGKSPFVQVVSGAFFTACVTAAGEVYLWGDNYSGQCSVGSSLAKKGPIQEQPNKVLFRGNKVTQVACGATFVIALTEGDRVLGWGSAHLLGIGTGAETVPCERCLIGTTDHEHHHHPGASMMNNINAEESNNNNNNNSSSSSFANSSSTFASNNNNNGNTPAGSPNNFYLPIENEMQRELISNVSTVPCSIAGLCGKQITCISSGNFHSIAVTKTGAVYTWGFGGHGQLGVNSTNNASVPKKVDPSHFSPMQVESVFCGANHTAAVAKGGFAMWLWGDNRHGQCGVCHDDDQHGHSAGKNDDDDDVDDFLGHSTSSLHNSSGGVASTSNNNNKNKVMMKKHSDSHVLVPTRVKLNFKQQRASIITVALGTTRTCILFSDGDVAIFGCQIPFSCASGGGNCSGSSASGPGCHNVFGTASMLCSQLAISQIAARHDHLSITACKRDIAVITLGTLPGGFSFGCRIEYLTVDDPNYSSSLSSSSSYYAPSLSKVCGDTLNSWSPILPPGTQQQSQDEKLSASASALQKCVGNPVCVAVGGSHTLIGCGYFTNSHGASNNSTNSNSNSPSSASSPSSTRGSVETGAARRNSSSSSPSSRNNNNNNAGSNASSDSTSGVNSTSCVVSYGSNQWGQLGSGPHIWKYLSSSSSPLQTVQASSSSPSSSPANSNGPTPVSSGSTIIAAGGIGLNTTSIPANNNITNNTANALVKHPSPVFFSTSKEASSPYNHKNTTSTTSPFVTPNTSERENRPQFQQQQQQQPMIPPPSPTNSKASSANPSSGGVKLTLRSLASGHAFCFAIFSAPTSAKNNTTTNNNNNNTTTSPKHPTAIPHHRVQQQEDTIIYFWGNNNHHQSAITPLVLNNNSNNSGSSGGTESKDTNNINSEQSNVSSSSSSSISTKYDSPVLVPALSGKGVMQIACGSFFSMALTADGQVYTWGLFDCCGLGQFSDFDPTSALSKNRVLQKQQASSSSSSKTESTTTSPLSSSTPPPTLISKSLTKEQRNCVCLPLNITDMILGASNNTTGDSTSISSNSSNSNIIVRVAAGPWHAAVLSRRGQVFTWGFGTNNRLGLGADDLSTHTRPIRVDLPVRVRDITCGHANTAAISVHDSSLYVWGDNEYGQCGINSSNNSSSNNNNKDSNSTSPSSSLTIPEPKKAISNGVRSVAVTRTCCIAVMWNGAVMISGVMEDSSTPSSSPMMMNRRGNNNTTISNIGIQSRNHFVSIQSAVLSAAKQKLPSSSSSSLLESSLKAQPGVAVSMLNEVLTLFPTPPPTSAFLDDDDDDDDNNTNIKSPTSKSPRSSGGAAINKNNTNKRSNSIDDELDGGDPDEEEFETRTFHAMDVVASLQHVCLVVEMNRPTSGDWNGLRKAMKTSLL